jgi:hypothetical protein
MIAAVKATSFPQSGIIFLPPFFCFFFASFGLLVVKFFHSQISVFSFQLFPSIGIFQRFSLINRWFFLRSVFLSSGSVLKSLRG